MRIRVLLVVGGIAGAAGALMALRMRTEGDPREAMAHRMREHLESMPEDFPPRVMFDNLAATRTNTERILQLLGGQGAPASDDVARTNDEEPGATGSLARCGEVGTR